MDEKVARLQDRITEIGNPENQYAVYKASADKRKNIETSIKEYDASFVRLHAEQAEYVQALETFAGLDNDISSMREKIEEHKPGYNQYVRNHKTAEQLPERKTKVANFKTELDTASDKTKKLRDQLTEISLSYSSEEHNQLNASFNQLNRDQAALESRVESLEGQLTTTEEKVNDLLPLESQKESSQTELDTLNAVSDSLTFLRKTIRDAGPHIVKQLLQTISEEADRIFGEILNDYTVRLNWTNDYEIQLEQNGYTREFSQLSGGEKMAAALAVRLALLREMSEIRLAFFDEPTANLDDERRNNLAQQITKIKGFEQLFVISHDDTFERETDLVLHISKENGKSRIEQEG